MNEPQRHDKFLIRCYCAAAIAIHSAMAILGVYFPGRFGYSPSVYVFSDVSGYRSYAKLICDGRFPYGDLEYPPLALLFFVAPYIVAPAFDVYKLAFACEMLAISALAVWLVAREAKRTGGVGRVAGSLAWYTAYFVALCPLIVTRFDLAPMFLAFLAATSFARDRPATGGIAAGIGTLTKLVPGLTILPELASAHPSGSRSRSAGAMLVTLGVGLFGSYILGGGQILATLRYHAERGLEIESLYSSIYIIIHMAAGIRLSGRHDHQSINVYGAGWQLVAWSSTVLQCACLLLVARRARRDSPSRSTRPAATLLLAYIVTSKVLSPQYLIWLMPFVAVSGSGRLVFLVCCILTTAIFPWNFEALARFDPWAECLQVGRNIGLIWLFAVTLGGERRPRLSDGTTLHRGE